MSEFVLINHRRESRKEFETKAEAEEKKDDMIQLGVDSGDLEVVTQSGSDASGESEQPDGAKNVNVEETSSNGSQAPEVVKETADEYDLPDEGPRVDEDPLVWMPEEFTDTIQGTTTINRKGFEVLAHHYDIECDTTSEVVPSENGYEYAVVKATAIDADGDTYGAYGEAKVDEDDMNAYELLRYADTRAYKRAISRATGVGMVAIEELKATL